MGPIGAKRGIAAGLRGSAEPRRLRTTDARRRRTSVVRQAVILRLIFRFGSALNILSGYGSDSIAEVAVDRTRYDGTVIPPVSPCEPLCARLGERLACVPAFTCESKREPFVRV